MPTPSKYDTYTSPLAERNASPEMLRLWSPRHKFNTWRRIWLAVAEAQHELGLPVSKEQVEELRAAINRKNPDGSIGITDAEIQAAEQYERELRHDVMAHVHALGDATPKAKGIIHLGMTSQDVVCNADAVLLQRALDLIKDKAAAVVIALADMAERFNQVPCLGFTHYQPAQPLTVGRRIIQWASDLELCYRRLNPRIMIRGLRGATGAQASFLQLIPAGRDQPRVAAHPILRDPSGTPSASRTLGNAADPAGAVASLKLGVDALEDRFEGHLTFDTALDEYTDYDLKIDQARPTGQTYPRVIDTFILADLASTASVLHKIATDIRLLSNRKELDEPFETKQIGSSAMPYKRNPMRCERICGLTRFVMNLVGNAYDTAATQWLERTLDDSSNRRLSLPEAFLALDGALDLMRNVASGLIVHEAMVKKNLMAELPFMATENLLMACVKAGGDRQHYHEFIRQHAQAAGMRVKQEGLDNDLLDRLKSDKSFWSKARGGPLSIDLDWSEGPGGLLDPMNYIGRSVEQTQRFIKEVIDPLRAQHKEALASLSNSGPRV